jgi:IS30 family transposase
VFEVLKKGWSPEQISGRMEYQKLTIYICPETIYQYVCESLLSLDDSDSHSIIKKIVALLIKNLPYERMV